MMVPWIKKSGNSNIVFLWTAIAISGWVSERQQESSSIIIIVESPIFALFRYAFLVRTRAAETQI